MKSHLVKKKSWNVLAPSIAFELCTTKGSMPIDPTTASNITLEYINPMVFNESRMVVSWMPHWTSKTEDIINRTLRIATTKCLSTWILYRCPCHLWQWNQKRQSRTSLVSTLSYQGMLASLEDELENSLTMSTWFFMSAIPYIHTTRHTRFF